MPEIISSYVTYFPMTFFEVYFSWKNKYLVMDERTGAYELSRGLGGLFSVTGFSFENANHNL